VDPPAFRQDGFGTRLIVTVPQFGRVERLILSPVLSTPGSEQAIRARAAHLMRLGPSPIGRVLRVERKASALWTLAEVLDGVSLADILAALEFGTLALTDDEILELCISVVRAAGRMHEALGGLAHGALSPAHVVVMRSGTTAFTGAAFGNAIEVLKLSREQIWREFGLVVPAGAGAPRLDQRADVAQLGALVLAIGQRRSLGRDEYPDTLDELVSSSFPMSTEQGASSRLGMWLRDTMQLHGRVVFDSCVDAARKFDRILPKGCGDEAGALALRTVILQLCSTFPTLSRT